jgi:cysteine desulfuration protein SufE
MNRDKETPMANYPEKLQEYIDDFGFITTRDERAEYLIQISDDFKPVPESVATQPYDESHRVVGCESEAFVWAVDREDGTLDFYFDVLNPQGLSAKAMSAILDQSCSGVPLEQVASIDDNVIFTFFGKDVSMGKGRGLTGIINTVVYEANKRLGKF